MGLKFYVGEMQAQANENARMAQEVAQGSSTLQTAINQFLSAPLSGRAYDTAKRYFSVAYTPICRSLIMTAEAMSNAHKRMISDYQSSVSSIDTDEDEIQSQIDRFEQLKRDLENQMRTAKELQPSLERRYMNACDSIAKRREQIQKLYDFNGRSASFFSEYEACEQELARGLAQVSGCKAWNASSGTFELGRLDMTWATPINERWAQREAENTTYEIEVRMDEFGNPIYEVYRNGRLDYDLTVEYVNLMATLRLQQLDDVLNSPGGKLFTTIVSTALMFNGTKVMVQGLYELGKGLSIAYGVDAATGQMVPLLVQTDGLAITNVVTSISDGLAQTLTGVSISRISTGDTTPGGRSYSTHGAERAEERGFSDETIDSIIDNNMKTRKSKIDELGRKTWEYVDARGNKVVTNEWGGIVSVHSPAPGGVYIPK